MRRSRLESLLHDYCNGDLDDGDRREVERRLETDPSARALHEEVRAAQEALKLLRGRPEPPVAARDVFPGIQAAIAAEAFVPRPRLALEGLGTRYYRRLAIAATLLFAVTVGYISLAGPGSGVEPGPAPDRIAVVKAGAEKGPVELGSRREGISPDEFFGLLERTPDLGELRFEPVVNVIEIAGSR